jgi:multidrug transporter EmrE-like cation transporter
VAPSVLIGLLLALATALTSIVGFLYKHRGAVASPAVELARPVRTSLGLFRSRWYLLGLAVAMGSWGLHVAALSLAPISLVQCVIAGGLVMLTVVADRLFGQTITVREWIGVAAMAVGLAVLAATVGSVADSAHADYEAPTLALYVGVAGAAAAWSAVLARARPAWGAALLAVAAGLTWGGSDVCIKALSGRLDEGAASVLVNPLALVVLVASLVGLTLSARSLQVGRAVTVIALTSTAANVTTIAAGPIVFGEPQPDGPLGLGVRALAFGLVIVAAALTPAPRAVAPPHPEKVLS